MGYLPAHADAGDGIPPRSCGQTVHAEGSFFVRTAVFLNSYSNLSNASRLESCDWSLRLRDMMSVDTGTGIRTHTVRTRTDARMPTLEMHKQSQTPHGAYIYAALSHTPHAHLTHARTHARTRCAVWTRTHTQTHAAKLTNARRHVAILPTKTRE